ncbi:hypothetical protein BH20CHL5_BH20CHL5_12730 [soil metagenome]|jgi:hypothetical protein
MLGRIAIVGWGLVLGAGITVGLALLIPSLPDLSRYLRMRQM